MLKNLVNRISQKIAYIAPGGYTLRVWLQRMRGVRIGKKVWISQFVHIDELHPEAVEIGNNCTIGFRTSIFSHLYWGPRRNNEFGKVVIEKDVYIGPHSLILPNTRIGEGSVIKGGTVVDCNVPPYTFWGLPGAAALAKVTVPLTSNSSYEEFIYGLRPLREK
jgi:heptaprenylglycerol acetyltransferase